MTKEGNKELSYSLSLADTIQAVINRSFIIDYGIIQSIPSSGVVVVEMSAARERDDVRIVTCVLANIAAKNLTIDIAPVVGDKVMVFFPRSYNRDMFNVDNKEVLIDENTLGYNVFSGIAFPFNQCKTKSYKNIISVDDKGNFGINLGEDISAKINADGTMNITNGTANIDIASDNSVTINGHLKVTS